MNIILSDKNPDYTSFISEALNAFEKYNVKGIAIVAITDTENLTGYWNMDLRDKLTAENEIRFDVLDEFIKNNSDRYFESEEETDEA